MNYTKRIAARVVSRFFGFRFKGNGVEKHADRATNTAVELDCAQLEDRILMSEKRRDRRQLP